MIPGLGSKKQQGEGLPGPGHTGPVECRSQAPSKGPGESHGGMEQCFPSAPRLRGAGRLPNKGKEASNDPRLGVGRPAGLHGHPGAPRVPEEPWGPGAEPRARPLPCPPSPELGREGAWGAGTLLLKGPAPSPGPRAGGGTRGSVRAPSPLGRR